MNRNCYPDCFNENNKDCLECKILIDNGIVKNPPENCLKDYRIWISGLSERELEIILD